MRASVCVFPIEGLDKLQICRIIPSLYITWLDPTPNLIRDWWYMRHLWYESQGKCSRRSAYYVKTETKASLIIL